MRTGSAMKPSRAASDTVAAPVPGATPGVVAAAEKASGKRPAAPTPATTSPAANATGWSTSDAGEQARGDERHAAPQDGDAPVAVGEVVTGQPSCQHPGREGGEAQRRRPRSGAQAFEAQRRPVGRRALDDGACHGQRGEGDERAGGP